MMTVVIGGSGSGKSAYAEDYLLARSAGMKRFYIATMQVFGEEGRRKVERHQKLRAGKGFVTIERQTSVETALEEIRCMCPESEKEAAVLLECMSNLAANEMFSGTGEHAEEYATEKTLAERQKEEDQVAARVIAAVDVLRKNVAQLVIVTNNVFEDGCAYDDSTMAYIRVLGRINRHLAAMADRCVEIVVGITVVIKGDFRDVLA